VIALGAATLLCRTARAEESEAPPAVQYYEHALELYEQGRYREAAEELERARALDPNAPELLYNLGLVYERLNEFDRAIEYFTYYLRFDLDDDERERIERTIARLRGARQHAPEEGQGGGHGTETQPPPRVVVRRMGLADGWFWGMVGTTIALTVTAIATGTTALVYANDSNEFVVDDANRNVYDWLRDSARALRVTTDVLIGLAAATALTSVLLYVLRERPSPEGEEPEEDNGDEEQFDDEVPVFGERAGPRSVVPRVVIGLGGVMIGWEL
jgi:tetratricopeptide (TPR) repeat protein